MLMIVLTVGRVGDRRIGVGGGGRCVGCGRGRNVAHTTVVHCIERDGVC